MLERDPSIDSIAASVFVDILIEFDGNKVQITSLILSDDEPCISSRAEMREIPFEIEIQTLHNYKIKRRDICYFLKSFQTTFKVYDIYKKTLHCADWEKTLALMYKFGASVLFAVKRKLLQAYYVVVV